MPLDIDTSDLDPGARALVENFAAMVAGIPTEAVEFLIELLGKEIESRGQN